MVHTIGFQLGDLFSAAVAIDPEGKPLIVAAPSLIGFAEGVMLVPATPSYAAGAAWWAGWAALGSTRPHLATSLDRIYDPAFLPVLGRHLLQMLGDCIPADELETAFWAASLPARWGVDEGRAIAFGERLRETGTELEPLTIMANPEALGFGGLLTDRGERSPALRGKQDLLVVEVGSEAIEVAHLNRARLTRVVSIPRGIAHGLQPLRMGLQEQVGPLPLSVLVAALSTETALLDGAPETIQAIQERVPLTWMADISSWTDELATLIQEQFETLANGLETLPPIILGGEGLSLAPVRERLAAALGAQEVLPWYSMALGLARHAALTARRQLQPQQGGAA